MADVVTVSPVRSPGPAQPFSPSPPGSRPGTRRGSRPQSQAGSRPASREGYSGSRPLSQSGSRPISSSLSGSAGRYRTPVSRPISNVRSPGSAKSPQQRTPLTDRPESVRSLASRSSMPDYLKPIVKTALKRWKRFHEQRVMDRLKERKEEKKLRVIQAREEKMKLARRIPIDVLAREWLKDNEATVEVRAYLLEKLLPVLIMGVEKLLVEVDKRGLSEEDEPAANFNPINYLAQYLMRNNPRYSNFPEASPYIRGLQDVTDELKKEVFSFEDNRLAKVKAEARRRREERERASRLKALENQRRSATLREQYKEWLVNQDGRVELHLVQEALKSFAEITESYPEEIKKASEFSHELESLDETGKTVSIKEFADYIKQFITDMPPEIFTEFLKHLSKCASAVRAAADSEARREILTNLFVSCDHSGVGLLDRHRVLNLFETFYDNATSFIKKSIRNPRKWPVVELDEVTDETDSVRSESPRDEIILESDKEARTAAEKEKDEDTTAVERPSTPTKEATEEPAEDAEKTDEVKTGDDDEKAEGEAELAKEDDTTEKVEEKNEEETDVKEEETAVVEDEGNDDVTPAAGSPKPSADEEIKAEDEKVSEGTEATAEEKVATDVEKETTVDEKEASADEKEAVAEEKEAIAEEKEVRADEKETAADEKEIAAEEKETAAEEKETATDEKETTTVDKMVGESEKESTEKKGMEPESKETKEEKATNETQEKIDEQTEGLATPITTTSKECEDDATLAVEDNEEIPVITATDRASVTFAEEALLLKEKSKSDLTKTQTPTTRSGSVVASAFDENYLNVSQFVQLIELFLGDEPNKQSFDQVLRYIKSGYVETEEEKLARLKKARHEAMTAKRRTLLDLVFEKWDNDGSGYLELDEILLVLGKYKENMEHEAIEKAKKTLSKDDKLSKREFRKFIETICRSLPGGEVNFEPVIEFLTTSVERSYTERIRGQARKKWLAQIIIAAETGGASMDPVYKAVFQALYKDAESHGNGKRISANVALLENNEGNPSRGTHVLRYSATTQDDAGFMLGKALYKDMKGISFASVESGKPIHVPRVKNHGNIHFWNPDRYEEFKQGIVDEESNEESERDGSLIVVPLKNQEKRVFGLMGIDTLADPHAKSIFLTHEISFFQGVAKAFSTAFNHVDIRRKTLRIAESALSWIHRRSLSVFEINVYMVEPDEKQQDYVLRKMITTNKLGQVTVHPKPLRLERKDNLFRDYLFRCVDNSETVTADAYGERHTSFPLRDSDGHAVAIIDISIGQLRQLPSHENKEVQKMLKLLQMAHKEVASESAGGDKNYVLEAEKTNDEDRINVLFDRIMLMDLRENVAKLDVRAFAELRSYKDPPKIIHDILIGVLAVFYADKVEAGEFDLWNSCKPYVNTELIKRIMEFDPTASGIVIPSESVVQKLTNVPHGAVAKHGSMPAQYLYNWAFVCLSLIEHTAKTKASQKPRAVTPPKSSHSLHSEELI